MIITNVINEGNQNNVKICINADTYLEKIFYQKCASDNRKIQIYYEWQNTKNRYIHQTSIIAHDFPNYSVHDQEHSRTIIESIEMLLGRWRIERFGIGNAWLLLNAAYGHDIGMVIQHQEALELWRDDREFQKYLDNICNNPESDMQEALQYCRQLHNVLHNKEKLDGIDESENVFQIYELTNDWPVVVKKNVMMITADYIRRHEQVFVQIENDAELNSDQIIIDKFCYKGVLVRNKTIKNRKGGNLISRYIPVSMDIMGMNASDCLLISRSHFTEKMNGRFEELAWKCFKLYVEIVAKHIKKLGLKNQLSDVVKNSRSPYLLLMGVLYFGKNSDVAYICEQNVWADTTYFMQHLKKDSKKYKLEDSVHVTFNDVYEWFSSEDKMIVWKVNRTDLQSKAKTILDIVSIMNEEASEEVEKTSKYELSLREKTENYLKKTVKTEADPNYIITDPILVNILEEFIEKKGVNRDLFKIQSIDQEDMILSVYDPGYNLKKEQNTDTEEQNDLREILLMAIKEEKYYIVVGKECDRKFSELYVRKAPLNNDLTEEYLENHKVILFPFNVDIYGVMREWSIKINIPDIDTENKGIEREQNFWDYVLNNPAWERAVQWTMKHGVNKKSFQQRGAITQQYKELCKEFLKAYIDYCKRKKEKGMTGQKRLYENNND